MAAAALKAALAESFAAAFEADKRLDGPMPCQDKPDLARLKRSGAVRASHRRQLSACGREECRSSFNGSLPPGSHSIARP